MKCATHHHLPDGAFRFEKMRVGDLRLARDKVAEVLQAKQPTNKQASQRGQTQKHLHAIALGPPRAN